jgi:hypothetical protein
MLLMLLMLFKIEIFHISQPFRPLGADGYPRRSPAALPTDLAELPSWQLDLSLWKTLDNYVYIYNIIYIYIQWTTDADFLKHFETALSMSFNAFQGGFKEMIS